MNSGKIIRRSKALKLIADLQSIHAQNKKVGITQDSDLAQIEVCKKLSKVFSPSFRGAIFLTSRAVQPLAT